MNLKKATLIQGFNQEVVIPFISMHGSTRKMVEHFLNALMPKLKFASVIGSYGWGGKMIEHLKGMLTNLKVEIIEPVIIKGFPREHDLQALERLADEILKKHKENKIV